MTPQRTWSQIENSPSTFYPSLSPVTSGTASLTMWHARRRGTTGPINFVRTAKSAIGSTITGRNPRCVETEMDFSTLEILTYILVYVILSGTIGESISEAWLKVFHNKKEASEAE